MKNIFNIEAQNYLYREQSDIKKLKFSKNVFFSCTVLFLFQTILKSCDEV